VKLEGYFEHIDENQSVNKLILLADCGYSVLRIVYPSGEEKGAQRVKTCCFFWTWWYFVWIFTFFLHHPSCPESEPCATFMIQTFQLSRYKLRIVEPLM